jgi:hypothetical protein
MTSAEDPNGAAVAGLASELEMLRRKVTPLPGRLDEVAELLAELTDRVRKQAGRPRTGAMPSWLVAPTDPAVTRTVLDELDVWVRTVFLRYRDGATTLPDCWLWHPDVVEELLWLMHAWLAAYQGDNASVGLVGDWHDRYRPGVIRRVKALCGTCSLEVHQPGWVETTRQRRRPDAASRIALWWAESRNQPGPDPSPEDMVDPWRGAR